MKNILLLLAFVTIIACSAKKEEISEATLEEWPAMDAYHLVMAEVYHPYKDSANLEPLKAQATDLVKAADTWLNAPLPAKLDTEEVKSMLADLKTNSEALAQLSISGSATEIGDALTKLHDQFHALQDAFYGGGGHQHHKH